MALLEIDSQWLRDERCVVLAELAGIDRFSARGRVEALWFDCIEKTRDVRTIEEVDILAGWFHTERGHFVELMAKARLAEAVDGGYRIRGVGERMAWLKTLRDKRAEAGKKGGRVRAARANRDDHGRLLPVQTRPKQERGAHHSNTTQNQANPAYSVTVSVSDPVSVSGTGAEDLFAKGSANPVAVSQPQAINPEGESPTARTWRAYREAYAKRHGEPPKWNAAMGGMFRQLVARLGAEDAPKVAAYFVTVNEPRTVSARHPVGWLLKNAEGYHTDWATGSRITSQQAQQAERRDANVAAMQDYLASEKGGRR